MQTADTAVSFDLKTNFTPGELYELRITVAEGTVSWELVKPAQAALERSLRKTDTYSQRFVGRAIAIGYQPAQR